LFKYYWVTSLFGSVFCWDQRLETKQLNFGLSWSWVQPITAAHHHRRLIANFAIFLCLSLNQRKSEVIIVHQNLISNWLTCFVYVKSTGELLSFGFIDRSVLSLVSANCSAKTTSLFGWSLAQFEFRTLRKSQRKTSRPSEMTDSTVCVVSIVLLHCALCTWDDVTVTTYQHHSDVVTDAETDRLCVLCPLCYCTVHCALETTSPWQHINITVTSSLMQRLTDCVCCVHCATALCTVHLRRRHRDNISTSQWRRHWCKDWPTVCVVSIVLLHCGCTVHLRRRHRDNISTSQWRRHWCKDWLENKSVNK